MELYDICLLMPLIIPYLTTTTTKQARLFTIYINVRVRSYIWLKWGVWGIGSGKILSDPIPQKKGILTTKS